MYKRFKYFIKVLNSRFKILRFDVKILLAISIFSILATELFLNKIPAYSQFQYDFGRVFLKVCYAYFSAFIFYYLVIFLPKERRKVKAFRLVNNTIHLINGQKNGLILGIIKSTDPKITVVDENLSLEALNKYCKNVNPENPIKFGKYLNSYENHFDAVNQRAIKIKSHINDLININELLSDEMFLSVINLNIIVTESLKADRIEQTLMPDLSYLSNSIYDLHFEVTELENKFRNSYSKQYNFQYHHFERKRNKRRLI